MRLALLALAALGVACAPEGGAPELATESAAASAESTESAEPLWLEPGQLGHEEQARWGLPLPAGTTIVLLGDEAFFAACRAANDGKACPSSTRGYTLLGQAPRVTVRPDTPAELSLTILHELGHVLRGSDGHLPCLRGESWHVMCPEGNAATAPAWPTDADLSFVLP